MRPALLYASVAVVFLVLLSAVAVLSAYVVRLQASLAACEKRSCLPCKCPLSSRLSAATALHAPPSRGRGPLVCTLAYRRKSIRELRLLALSLRRWEPDARLYVLSEDPEAARAAAPQATVVTDPVLFARYAEAKNMADMERFPGGDECHDLRTRFMYEKLTVMELVFDREPEDARAAGVWFLDSDVVLLSALPAPPCDAVRLGVTLNTTSFIVDVQDGRYNGGVVWTRDPSLLHRWRELGTSTTFFEQQPLEPLVASLPAAEVWHIDEGMNMACWRFATGGQFGARAPRPGEPLFAGLTYKDRPVLSLHHHFVDSRNPNGDLFEAEIRALVEKNADRLEGLRWFKGALAEARAAP